MNDASKTSGLTQLKIDRTAKTSGRKKSWLMPLSLVALAALGALAYVFVPRAVEVDSTTVVMSTPSQQFVNLTASGYVVAQRRAAVASKASGRLVELHVREGSQVKQGDLLAKLDDSDIRAAILGAQANIHQAEANVRQQQVQLINARAELARTRGLESQGFVSPQMVDNALAKNKMAFAAEASAEAALEQAKAQLKAQNVGIDYTEIRAPFDGVVLVKNANVGDIITPMSSAAGAQGAVVTMADMSTLEVEADVSESNLSKVRISQPVEVVLDALPKARFKGHVSGIVPTVDRAKATVMTKIKFDQLDPAILPEMSAKVSFLSKEVSNADQQAVVAVPETAIVRENGTAFVYKLQSVEGGKFVAQQQSVKVGRKLAELTEITSGLQAGDKVVGHPSDKLKPGSTVTLSAP
jgi:HlyD family secretion protein